MTMTTTAVHAAATGHPAYTETMPCRPESARKARMLLTLALSAWDLDELLDDAKLVVSEFVGNSAKHTGCHLIRVTVTRLSPDRVRVAVIDKSVTKPAPRTATADAENGRGLAVVAALTETTGADTFRWGKRTWADLRIPGAGHRPTTPGAGRESQRYPHGPRPSSILRST
ncbi:ATP-binding protein [Streptomyces sp. NPDC002785]|uniref:ATP-binding protein n=1 Tax=Streptomyces sp. NPDC002785 TaxID=3154543 RepID=UPI00331E432A